MNAPIKTLCLGLAALALSLAPAAACAQESSASESPNPNQGPRWLEEHRFRVDFQPIGMVLPEGRFSLGRHIPMHPVGFRADEYRQYLIPSYGLGGGWEIAGGVVGAQRLGPGGEALFCGFGVQKEIIGARKNRPAVSIGGYGMTGPHDHHSGSVYAVATHRLFYDDDHGIGFYMHGGGRFEIYGSDDYGDGTGIRPFVGFTLGLRRNFTLSADYSPSQPWEDQDTWSVRANVRVYKRFFVSGGIRSNGFRTEPFFGVSF